MQPFRGRFRSLYPLLLGLLSFSNPSPVFAAAEPLIIKGSKFFYESNGTQFFVRGLIYSEYGQLAQGSAPYIDMLADDAACRRDIPAMLRLGINTVRLYTHDSRLKHKLCMTLFEEAGIYVMVVVNGKREYTIQQNYTDPFPFGETRQAIANLVDPLHHYSNLLGFVVSAGNSRPGQFLDLPLEKYMTREIKEYIKSKGYRSIPVGAEGYDMDTIDVPRYLVCGSDDVSADFWVGTPSTSYKNSSMRVNRAMLCGTAQAAYPELIERFRDFGRPIIWPHGCHANDTQHTWDEVQQFYEHPLTDVFSGVLIDEWFPGRGRNMADTGLAELTESGSKLVLRPAFYSLSSRFANISPTPTQMSAYTPEFSEYPCENLHFKQGDATYWNLTEDLEVNKTIPARTPKLLCSCMMPTLSCRADPNVDKDMQSEVICTMLKNCTDPHSESPSFCYGTSSFPQIGRYDSYFLCNDTERLSWILNQVYDHKGNDSSVCSSIGGILHQPTPSASLSPNCQALLKQAGVSGTGTVTYVPMETEINSLISQKQTLPLSTGTKVGIGIAVSAFAAILFAGVVICFCIRKRRLKQKSHNSGHEDFQKAELPNNTISASSASSESSEDNELGEGRPQLEELATISERIEAEGDHGAAEMPTSLERVEAEGDHGAVELPTPFNEYQANAGSNFKNENVGPIT